MTPDLLDARGVRQARALAHPMRHRLLQEVGADGATTSQLANRLRTNKGNVAHHLGVLVDAGLLRRGRTRTVRGGTEQYFERAAQRIRFEGGPDGVTTTAMMQTLTEDLIGDPEALFNHRILRMTAPQAEALARHLDTTVHGLQPAGVREPAYGVVVSVYRRLGSPRRRPTGRTGS